MADKGIIFSAPMVRALIDRRKTQTRRLLRNPEYYGCPTGDCPHDKQAECNAAMAALTRKETGYAVGDRLYVRENWQALSFGDYLPTKSRPADVRFAATDPCADLPADARGYPWRPCIHMPRWASRIWLEVTDVRVQRLQEISEAEAIAEGVDMVAKRNYRDGYAVLWNSLHAKPGTRWDDNPWVVAVGFTANHGNIDQVQP